MKLVTVDENNNDPKDFDDLIDVLEDDGIICFPAETNYRLGASALSPKAVNNLVAAKRRSKHAPSLVFLAEPDMLDEVASDVPEVGRLLAEEFWPGPLTLLVEPGSAFPKKVRKTLSKATGFIGVRVPSTSVARGIVKRFGKPLLVSSANLSKKSGASSPAQVRKNFGRLVQAMVDTGDLPSSAPSTLVSMKGDAIDIRRAGAVSEEEIRRIAARE